MLDLTAAGPSNATIGARPGLSITTIGNHTSTIFGERRGRRQVRGDRADRDAGLYLG